MHFICSLWIVVVSLKFGWTNTIPCDVQHTADGTLYSVPEFNGTYCDYSWNNSTNHKLGTNLADKVNKVVVTMSDHALLIRECVEKILYRQECKEKTREGTCSCTCSEHQQGILHYGWIIFIVVCIVLLVLLIVGLICRCRNPSHAAVTSEDNEPNDVEEHRV